MNQTLQLKIVYEQARVPVTVFQLTGDIEAYTQEILERAVAEACAAGTQWLLLDLSGVSFMGSAGLRALHQVDSLLRRQASSQSGGSGADTSGVVNDSFKSPYLKLLNPNGTVARTLQISGFTMAFDVFSDRQQCLAAF